MRGKWFCTVLVLVAFATSASSQTAPACGFSGFKHDLSVEASTFGKGIKAAPRNAIRLSNLKWELPIAAATAILVTQVDWPADRRIQSISLQEQAGRWSNIGLGAQITAGALAYAIGCRQPGRSYLRETGFTALTAMGVAGGADLALKAAFNREYPYQNSSQGRFWAGGKSFPSGHSATSFAFASVVAHRYPQKKWLKWGAYGLAAGISLSRYPAKKHFPSDILAGATLGYVIGTYMAEHSSY